MVPVVGALAPHVRVSVDTVKPAVAEAAVAAGATLVNDVSASLWPVAAADGVGWVAMHMRGTPGTMQDDPRYDDVVGRGRAPSWPSGPTRRARPACDEVWVDPGIGFGKTVDHNLALLRHLPELVAPGASRWWSARAARASSGAVAAGPDGASLPVEDRLPGSLATATWAMLAGAAMVRVHDVAADGAGRDPGGRLPACRGAARGDSRAWGRRRDRCDDDGSSG